MSVFYDTQLELSRGMGACGGGISPPCVNAGALMPLCGSRRRGVPNNYSVCNESTSPKTITWVRKRGRWEHSPGRVRQRRRLLLWLQCRLPCTYRVLPGRPRCLWSSRTSKFHREQARADDENKSSRRCGDDL